MIRARDPAHAVALAREGMPYAAGLTASPVTRARPAPRLIDIAGIDAFRGVTLEGDVLRIGALTTLETLRRDPLVAAHAHELAALLPLVGSLQVRNLGTLGGNIAWGHGDLVPVLIAAGARLRGPGLDAAVEDFTEGLIGDVVVPVDPSSIQFAEKVGWRAAFSPALVTVAGRLRVVEDRIETCRLATGGGAPARRLVRSEQGLIGQVRSGLNWTAVTEAIAHETGGGHRGAVAARVMVHHLTAVMT